MNRIAALLLICALVMPLSLVPTSADTRLAPEDRGASGLALLLRRLQTIASVLHTAAHPDDESTEMLAYCARKEGARAAYLSLNRGDGGQNGIGPELWEMLGVLRTEELLASRKIDGAEQYFTRAMDFGFTRSPEETLQKWNREEVLGDMVRVIRRMRPLVVVNGFSGTAADGHGQHQVAGLLTPEAIKAAADPNRFPEQIKQGLQPWSVLKFYARRFRNEPQGARAEFDVGANDPVMGRSYMEIAADGRSRHRSQDFGQVQPRGSFVRSFPRLASPLSIEVKTPDLERSLFEGLDVSLTGVAKFAGKDGERLLPALTKIKEHAAQALSEFRIEHPDLSAPHLAAGLREIRALRTALGNLDPVSKANVEVLLARKEQEFNDALARAHSVIVDALSNTEIVAPGEAVEISANVYLGATGKAAKTSAQIKLLVPAAWQVTSAGPEVEAPSAIPAFFRLRETPDANARFRATVPANEAPSQPYWLAQPRTKDQFDWPNDEASDWPFNQPFAPPLLRAQVTLELNGERVVLTQPVEYRYSDKTFGEFRRELKVAPALTLNVSPALLVVPSGAANRTREITVEITHNARRATNGAVKLEAPAGWKVESPNDSKAAPLAFTKQGEKTARTFKVTPPPGANGNFELKAVATADGADYATGYTKIEYSHIEPRYVYKPATAKLELFDVKVAANLKVGYVMGSGDDGPEALRQLGVNVHLITPAELAASDLSVYDTIVLGIRVYEVNDAVMANNRRLLDYVTNGGTLIVQYNKNEYETGNYAPYPAKVGRGDRVTDENAPITILVPEHPLFNFPNKINDADWKGWVQERGLYYLSEWDAKYTPLLAAPNEKGEPLKGGQLIAQVGKGSYVYTSYAWFRQFPAGVPGAYRLFANLVSLPKAAALKK